MVAAQKSTKSTKLRNKNVVLSPRIAWLPLQYGNTLNSNEMTPVPALKKKISTSDRLSPRAFLSKLRVKGAGQHSDNPQVTSNKRGRTGELRERTHVDRKPCWCEVSVQNMESKNETSYSDSGCTPYRMLSATPFFFMSMVMGARDLSDKQGGSSG